MSPSKRPTLLLVTRRLSIDATVLPLPTAFLPVLSASTRALTNAQQIIQAEAFVSTVSAFKSALVLIFFFCKLSCFLRRKGGKCKGGPSDGCECKAGWEGALCESPVKDDSHASQGEACGAGYCYNNGVCVQTKITKNDGTEVTEFHCDCNSAFDDTNRYGGLSCEHESTSFCARSNQGESLQG